VRQRAGGSGSGAGIDSPPEQLPERIRETDDELAGSSLKDDQDDRGYQPGSCAQH
jgi:hypothetical protein